MHHVAVVLSLLLLADIARSSSPIAPSVSSQYSVSTSDSLNGIVFTFTVSSETLRGYDSLSMALTAFNKTSKADTILMMYRSCGWELLNDSGRVILSDMPPDTGIILVPFSEITYIIEPNQSAEIYHTSITFIPPARPATYSLILYYSGFRLKVGIPVGEPVTKVTNPLTSKANAFQLFQNYPNPFNPTTTISYSLPKKSRVALNVYDVLGREVVTLVNKEMEAGTHSQLLNALNLPSGIYFYRIEAGYYTQTKKFLLLK